MVIRCAATTGSRGEHDHPVAVERTLDSHGIVGDVAERPLRRQREADLGRAQVASAELLGRPDGDDLAGAHDRDAVGEVLRLVHVVRGQEDRLAELAQRADRRPRLTARGRVKPGRRLVEEDQLRVADERQRQVEPPPLTARQLLGADVALLGQLDELDHLVDRAPPGVVAAVHLDQLGDRSGRSARPHS